MTASVNFPLYLGVAVFAPEIVILLFGNQWEEAIPLLRILALWGLVRSTGNPIGSLVFAVGRADLQFYWNLVLFFCIFPVVWLGSQYGSTGIAIAQLLLIILLFIPMWYILVRPLCGAGLKEYTVNLAVPLWISLCAALFAYIITLPFSYSWLRLLIGFLSGAFGYMLLSIWFNREWVDAIRSVFTNFK